MARTIFNSTEKSNFILNMTEEQYAKLASYGIIGSCILVSLFTVVPEVLVTSTYTITAGGTAVAGVYCMIMALIAGIKKYIKGSAVLPVFAFGVMFAWSLISTINSYDKYVGIYGYPQRGEGAAALLFGFCVFTAAASIQREKAVNALKWGLICSGILNSGWSLIQIFAVKFTHYKFASLDMQVNAASGLSQSPLFLAMVLTLSLTAAMITAVTSQKGKEKILCAILSLIFAFVMIFTYSFISLCGIAFAVVASFVASISAKSSKKGLAAVIMPVVGAVLAIVVINAGVIADIEKPYALHDGRLLWWSDSYMRIGASGDFNSQVINIDNTKDVYLYLNQKGKDIAANAPITGTGPDQLAYAQLYTSGGLGDQASVIDIIPLNTGTFDRVYNEYIQTAATRGVPSLIALVILLLCALKRSFAAMKKRHDQEGALLFLLTLCGILLFVIGCNNPTFALMYWCIAGLACANLKASAKKPSKAS